MSRSFLRGAVCALALVASSALAQTYTDAATLQMMRSNIEQLKQQVVQLRSMGVDAATLNLMNENVRYLELQYASLAGTGPAPGSPQMVAAERAWLDAQLRNLQVQRQQLAQMGADAGSLAMLDQSIAALRQSMNELGATTAYTQTPAPSASGLPPIPPAGPGYRPFVPPERYTAWGERVTSDDIWRGYNTIGPNGIDCTPMWSDTLNRFVTRQHGCPAPGAKKYPPGSEWVATYNPIGPNGQDCTPFFHDQLNRWLVPGGCPMPGAGQVPGQPAPSTFVMPPAGNYGINNPPASGSNWGTPTGAGTSTSTSGTRTPVTNPRVQQPLPQFESAGFLMPLPSIPPSRGVLTSPPMASAEISFCGDPNVVYARRPICDQDGRITQPGVVATASGGGAGSGGGTLNWGQKDPRAPSIQTTRSPTSKFEQSTTISRYDITIDACKVKEARVDYKHNGFLGDAQITGKVTLIGANGCTPKPNTRLFLRLEQGGLVGWIELRVTWHGDGTGGFSSLLSSDKAVWKLEGLTPTATWDKATAIKFFTDGVVKGFLVVPGK